MKQTESTHWKEDMYANEQMMSNLRHLKAVWFKRRWGAPATWESSLFKMSQVEHPKNWGTQNYQSCLKIMANSIYLLSPDVLFCFDWPTSTEPSILNGVWGQQCTSFIPKHPFRHILCGRKKYNVKHFFNLQKFISCDINTVEWKLAICVFTFIWRGQLTSWR